MERAVRVAPPASCVPSQLSCAPPVVRRHFLRQVFCGQEEEAGVVDRGGTAEGRTGGGAEPAETGATCGPL